MNIKYNDFDLDHIKDKSKTFRIIKDALIKKDFVNDRHKLIFNNICIKYISILFKTYYHSKNINKNTIKKYLTDLSNYLKLKDSDIDYNNRIFLNISFKIITYNYIFLLQNNFLNNYISPYQHFDKYLYNEYRQFYKNYRTNDFMYFWGLFDNITYSRVLKEYFKYHYFLNTKSQKVINRICPVGFYIIIRSKRTSKGIYDFNKNYIQFHISNKVCTKKKFMKYLLMYTKLYDVIIVQLTLICKPTDNYSHANSILINKYNKNIIHIEPHGRYLNKNLSDKITKAIYNIFYNNYIKKDYKYLSYNNIVNNKKLKDFNFKYFLQTNSTLCLIVSLYFSLIFALNYKFIRNEFDYFAIISLYTIDSPTYKNYLQYKPLANIEEIKRFFFSLYFYTRKSFSSTGKRRGTFERHKHLRQDPFI